MSRITRPLRGYFKASKRRQLAGDLAKRIVFDLIERVPSNAASKRVERILELLVSAEESRAYIVGHGLESIQNAQGSDHVGETERFHSPLAGFQCALPLLRFVDRDLEECNQRYRAALRELQTLLIRYQWRPTIQDRVYHSLGQSLLWDGSKPAEMEENMAVQFLIEQLDSSDGPARICRFRKCRECATWFYALKDHQLFCREPCRKSFASHSPEYKKKRAEYMRTNYRPREKQRSQRALKLVKGVSIATERISKLRPDQAERKSRRNESRRNNPGGENSRLKAVAKRPGAGRSAR